MINNNNGSIAMAIVVILIALMSGLSFSSIAFSDTNTMKSQIQQIQEFHLLRSEVSRGRLVCSQLQQQQYPPEFVTLPTRRSKIEFGSHVSDYNINTRIDVIDDNTKFKISTLIDSHRTGVKKYGQYVMGSLQTLAIFHYFTDQDLDASGIAGNIRFFGQDVIYGRVHSNTDIWIRQAGGGSNNGWPTFHGLVTTSGQIRVFQGSTYPENDIFLGGLIQNYPSIVFDPTADLVRNNASFPFGRQERDDRIAFIDINQSSFSSWRGNIVVSDPDTFIVYDEYPPYGPIGDSIGVNIIDRIDTLWSVGPSGNVINGSVFVPYELWISGNVRGSQTWASSHNIYIKDDITYTNTTPGLPPDGGVDGLHPVNTTDYFGLISEKHIIVQYGYKHPDNEIRYKPNTNSIFMYGAFCAMGQGSGIQPDFDKGVVTFQYHFPKGSTPAQIWQQDFYQNIDLHRFRYPTTAFDPWLVGLDYPWYNP